MKTSDRTKKDSLFLSSSQVPRAKRVSFVVNLIFQCLVCLAIAFGVYAWMVNEQFKLSMRQQADAVGQSLLIQTAERASELLAVDDKLGLNILLGSLAKNPLVTDVGIYDGKEGVRFKAGLKQFTHLSNADLYVEKLDVPNYTDLELRLRLNRQQFQLPWVVSVERAIIIAVILLLIVLIVLFLLSRKLTVPLLQLKDWVRYPVMPVPAINRGDEIGDLARELQNKLICDEDIEAYYAQFVPSAPDPVEEKVERVESKFLEDELNDSNFDKSFFEDIMNYNTPKPEINTSIPSSVGENSSDVIQPNPEFSELVSVITCTAVLCIRLGGQDKLKLLSKDRLINLLQRYRDCLDKAVRLYQGEIHTLSDGSSLVLFHGRNNDIDTYLAHSICCGELMRGLSHELQIELADTSITSLLQIALSQGPDLLGLTQQELLNNDTVKVAQTLANHSRNLLLIDQSIANDDKLKEVARIRGLANPIDTFCIESTMEPYAQLLEKQLRNMRNNKV